MSQSNVEGFRLSPQQKYVWSVQQLSASPIYQLVSTISVTGSGVRPEMLERALAHVVSRHEILRTSFHRPPGIKTPFQVISDEAQFSWQFSDLTNLDQQSRLNELEASFVDERAKPFDFAKGPLLRACLYRLSRAHHMLLISLSALCGDSVTVLNLMSEFGRAYGLLLGGEAFPSEPMQYADFAEWHNELLEGSDKHALEGRNYWQEPIARASLPLTLPLEKRRAGAQDFQPESIPVNLDSACVANLEALAQEYETSCEVVLFAFWLVLLRRLTRQSDFVIFKLCDGRKLEDLQDALGPFAEYLPVAFRSEDVPFAKHLEATRAALLGAKEWESYFDPNNISEAARDAVAFDFGEQHSPIETAGLKLSLASHAVCGGPFKLRLSSFRSADLIRAEFVYNAQSFDRETVVRYAGYFKKLVTTTSLADVTIDEIEILGEDEGCRLLVDINQTGVEFSETNCIHELFEQQAARTPESLALVCHDVELTYFELNARANQLAHLLRRRGLVPNACVGIAIERSVETIITLLGILKAGGAYVPLNAEHPPARLALQLAESNASFLISKDGTPNEWLEFDGERIDLDRDRALLLSEPEINPSPVSTAASLAYVIYTSGSSGVPKGVAVGHQSLLNYTQFILRRLQVKEPLHFATVSTITADLGNTCIFPALVSGGCLHLISYDVAMEGALLSDYIGKRPIDVLKIVPSHLSALLAAPHGDLLPRKYLILGGEALSWELVDRISETNPACEIINHYGPTETTVGSLTLSVKPHEVTTHSLTVPIGKPIANTCVYILDSQLKLAPTGVPGELYIGGAGLAVGYLNQPRETAARFVPNPFSGEPGNRLYRTGDLARYLPGGEIEFLGRVDHQVKVRGFRVELAEIETVLLTHKDVRQAVVISTGETASNQRLVGYLTTSRSKPPSVDELRIFLGQQLPDYMIPSTFVFLKTMPLTSNGKIDRVSLPAPDETRPDLQRLFVAPRTSVEKELACIWAELLKLNEVGVHDNFFELGGHSLLATQVVSRMRKEFEMEIPLRALFETPTVAALAETIEKATADNTARLLAELDQISDDEAARLLGAEKN